MTETLQRGVNRENRELLRRGKNVRRKNRATGTYYSVRWYNYRLRVDTIEPDERIPHPYQQAYLRGLQKEGRSSNKTEKKCKWKKSGALKDSNRNEDYKKRRNHSLSKFDQTSPPVDIMRRITAINPSRTSRDHKKFK